MERRPRPRPSPGHPILGGFLVQSVSWQSVFFLNVPVAALTVGIGLVVLPESRESVRQGSTRRGCSPWR